VDTWILVEYRGLWAHDAVDSSTLSAALKAHLGAERRRLPRARILFVRQEERRGEQGVLVFVARTGAVHSELRRLELDRHDDLVGLDLAAQGTVVEAPLFLVCTHGKHDRCCAKYGRPLYDAVREQVEPGSAWQSSHVGGDRFAGNLVVLPEGVYYGRVRPSESWPVIHDALERRIHLPCYRGRSAYGFAAQAAEIAVREATGLLAVADVLVTGIRTLEAGWRARVEAGGQVYEVAVRREEGEATHLTCSTQKLSRPPRHVAEILRARGA
jgi:hypothetical protein